MLRELRVEQDTRARVQLLLLSGRLEVLLLDHVVIQVALIALVAN